MSYPQCGGKKRKNRCTVGHHFKIPEKMRLSLPHLCVCACVCVLTFSQRLPDLVRIGRQVEVGLPGL